MTLEAFIALCQVASGAGEAVLRAHKKRLSDEEKEILIAVAQPDGGEGEFKIREADQKGLVLYAGSRRFDDPNDRARAATALEAFGSLCERGCVKYESGYLFTLTGSGFKAARELRDKS
jgi:hypothetical protein